VKVKHAETRLVTRVPERALTFVQWALNGVAKRALRDRRPRRFSNLVLRKYLAHMSGDIVNVSGWRDSDKEGGRYRDYYASPDRYVLSRIAGEGGMDSDLPADCEAVYLDLNQPLDLTLAGQFDVVFCHTVLEHVFDASTALQNLALLSRDLVAIVVPFSQSVHYTDSYLDYHRFAPYALKEFFESEGFSVLLSDHNAQPFFPVYVVFIGSRLPQNHWAHFEDAPRRFDVTIAPGRWGRVPTSGKGHLVDPSV
jgi:hypothetical protein